ncbi:hypothetical protein EYF80_031201 [Liparis tanakae]|uniref:Uncharacterized protein n=1 Tax=Liparis tanakae TaxID=230148 RepID=A0A4Z2GZ52_9TELE|nr:hypothetical protein EYF80_031201 [Liparis tanakae]
MAAPGGAGAAAVFCVFLLATSVATDPTVAPIMPPNGPPTNRPTSAPSRASLLRNRGSHLVQPVSFSHKPQRREGAGRGGDGGGKILSTSTSKSPTLLSASSRTAAISSSVTSPSGWGSMWSPPLLRLTISTCLSRTRSSASWYRGQLQGCACSTFSISSSTAFPSSSSPRVSRVW